MPVPYQSEEVQFLDRLFHDLGRSPDEKEKGEHLLKVYEQCKYGLFHLLYGVAKQKRFQEAKRDGTLRGSAQVVIDPVTGWIRSYEGNEEIPKVVKKSDGIVVFGKVPSQPLAVADQLSKPWVQFELSELENVQTVVQELQKWVAEFGIKRLIWLGKQDIPEVKTLIREANIKLVSMGEVKFVPYIKPGTGWKWDRSSETPQSYPEYDWTVIGAVLYAPLQKPLREMVDGQVALIESKAVPQNETLIEAFLRELLDWVVTKCWDEKFTQQYVNNAAVDENGEMKPLSPEKQRMEMRRVLLLLNEQSLEKRNQRQRETAKKRVPVAHADTLRGRNWNPEEAYEAIEESYFQEPVGRIDLEDLANQLLRDVGSADLVSIDD